jgi:hypothetical protein
VSVASFFVGRLFLPAVATATAAVAAAAPAALFNDSLMRESVSNESLRLCEALSRQYKREQKKKNHGSGGKIYCLCNSCFRGGITRKKLI